MKIQLSGLYSERGGNTIDACTYQGVGILGTFKHIRNFQVTSLGPRFGWIKVSLLKSL